MIKNWCCVQPQLYDCDPPTIHHASLSCKLSRAVKLKRFILKIRFLQTAAFFLFKMAWKSSLITFYLLSAVKIVDFLLFPLCHIIYGFCFYPATATFLAKCVHNLVPRLSFLPPPVQLGNEVGVYLGVCLGYL